MPCTIKSSSTSASSWEQEVLADLYVSTHAVVDVVSVVGSQQVELLPSKEFKHCAACCIINRVTIATPRARASLGSHAARRGALQSSRSRSEMQQVPQETEGHTSGPVNTAGTAYKAVM